jgi:hypothetical protein
MLVVMDDEDRENEGDLIMAAEFATAAKLGTIIRYTSGIICAPMYVPLAQCTPACNSSCSHFSCLHFSCLHLSCLHFSCSIPLACVSLACIPLACIFLACIAVHTALTNVPLLGTRIVLTR